MQEVIDVAVILNALRALDLPRAALSAARLTSQRGRKMLRIGHVELMRGLDRLRDRSPTRSTMLRPKTPPRR